MRNKKRRRETELTPPPKATTGQAVAAAHAATRRLAEAASMWPRINRVSSTLTREYEENDFAGRFRTAFGGQ